MEDAKAIEAMATLHQDGPHDDSHALQHPWGSMRSKQVWVGLENKHVLQKKCIYIRSYNRFREVFADFQ
jgi:hypothetical protein